MSGLGRENTSLCAVPAEAGVVMFERDHAVQARLWIFAFHACSALIRVLEALRGPGAFERATGILGPGQVS